MARDIEKTFVKQSALKAFDLDHRAVLNHNIGQYNSSLEKGISQFKNLENAKRKAHLIKWRVIENLDKLLPDFEVNFERKGGKVIWANDAQEALDVIRSILIQHKAKSVIKSKSMVTEEIGLNEFLEKEGIHPLETDLGEYIVQLMGQKPYHIVTPAMHLRKSEIAKLFKERIGTDENASAEELAEGVRKMMREQFTSADVGVTGANFLIADQGSIAITENEGNARLATTFPKVHIAITGIEKIIPSLKDLDLFWPLLSSHGTGQDLTVYNSVIGGPRQPGETDGPEAMYVILLDNGRTDLLARPEQRQGLYCIRCGACLNVCPIYQNIGGHTYDTVYGGPIGSLITPHTQGIEDFKHLSQASTLCGKCTEVCPVRIDISQMLLLNRRDAVREDHQPKSEKLIWKAFTHLAGRKHQFDFFSSKLKNLFLRTFLKKRIIKHRTLPKFSEKSFTSKWKSDPRQSQSP